MQWRQNMRGQGNEGAAGQQGRCMYMEMLWPDRPKIGRAHV